MSYANLFFIFVVAMTVNQPMWFTLTPVLIMIVNCALLHKYLRVVMRICI